MKYQAAKNPRLYRLLIGPGLFLLSTVFPIDTIALAARASIGCVLWMGYWWVSLPVNAAVTALIPVCVNALFHVIPMDSVISCYFSEIVVLLLGANLISLSWEETGLDKRLAMKVLCVIGPRIEQQVITWFLLSVVLSMFLPNAVVCAILISIAVSMLKFSLGGDIAGNRISMLILAVIAWGAGVGGMGTPLGGAMNLIAVGYLEELLGQEFLYVDWVVRLCPIMAALVIVNIAYFLAIRPRNVTLGKTKEYFARQYHTLGLINRSETCSLVLFLIAGGLSFTRTLFATQLPALKPAYIFLICGMLTFFIRKQDGTPMLTWGIVEKRIEWNLLFLFAGGLAVGRMISDSGAADEIADALASAHLTGGFWTALIMVIFTVAMAEIASNTAAAAISLPVVISIISSLNMDPVPYIFLVSAAFNVANMLPTSVRAIPVGYGLSTSYLFKNGLVLTILDITVITVLGFLLLL
ncbi:MAG: SLC13 family permease [Clostridiales bacterium]|nr:SLC13 family permease [Clostridiales bacterium]